MSPLKTLFLEGKAKVRNWYLEKVPFSGARRSLRKVAKIELGPRSVVLDLGANLGLFTEYFGQSGAKVKAYEPHPNAFGKLVERVGRLENIECIKAAVGGKPGDMFLYSHRNEEGDSTSWSAGSSLMAAKEDISDSKGFMVKVLDIADVILEFECIDLIKMDIEGAEVEVLNRILDQGLEGRIRHLFCETHEQWIPSLAGPTEVLRKRIAAKGLTNWDLNWH